MISIDSFSKISYGLYLISSGDSYKGNGYISNTFSQVTSSPAQFSTCCSKDNYTAELILKHKKFSVSVLHNNSNFDLINVFGYGSGKNTNKFQNKSIKYGVTGVPIVLNDTIAYFEISVTQIVDLGSHYMFIGNLIASESIDNTLEPLTYDYYKLKYKGLAPKNAPTYIDSSKLIELEQSISTKKYECVACGYIYNEASENKQFKDLDIDWNCPICGSDKSVFEEQ